VRPEDPLYLLREYGDFVFCEGHAVIKTAFQDSVKNHLPEIPPKTI
jgi:hypothetical protein